MWIVNLSLMTLGMACAVMGTTAIGLTLCVAAIAIEVLRRPAPRRNAVALR